MNKFKEYTSQLILVIALYILWTYPLTHNFDTYIFSNYFGDSAHILRGEVSSFPKMLYEIFVLLLIGIVSPAAAYNLLNLFAFICTYFGAFIFLRGLKVQYPLQILGSALMTIAPIRIAYSFEWPYLANFGIAILYFHFLFNLLLKKDLRSAYLAGIFFGLTLYNHLYQGLIIFFLSLCVAIFELGKEFFTKNRQELMLTFSRLAIAGAIAITLTLLIILLWQYDSRINTSVDLLEATRGPQDRWAYSAKPWHYLIPSINHPFLGNLAVNLHYTIWNSRPYYLTEPFFPKEHTLFLGYTLSITSAITIAIVLLKKYRTDSKIIYLIILLSCSIIFSMPPYVSAGSLRIYFPAEIIYEFIPSLRAFARFGAFAVFANIAIAMYGLNFLIRKSSKHNQLFIILIYTLITVFEFINFPPTHVISTSPPNYFVWLKAQPDDIRYLSIPTRTDYTDIIFEDYHGKTPLNPYLRTSDEIQKLEESFYKADLLDNQSYYCSIFEELDVDYLFFNAKYINKQNIINRYVTTGKLDQRLKIALMESWGSPIWGNHVPKSEEEELQDMRKRDLEQNLIDSKIFTLVETFDNTKQNPDYNFTSRNFERIRIFEINKEVCSNY